MFSGYLDRALAEVMFDKLEDGSFVGRIPSCVGVSGKRLNPNHLLGRVGTTQMNRRFRPANVRVINRGIRK